MPCYYLGLLIQTLFCCLMGIPFCLHEWLSGGVRPAYVFISFCCFIALSFIFYTMMYLSICKDYIKISLFYAVGSIISLFLSLFLVYYIGISVCMSMLLALTAGFLITASLGLALLTQYFTEYSHQYKKILKHIAKYRKLILANTFTHSDCSCIILYSGHLIYKSGLPVLSCVLKRMIMLHAWRCLRTFLQALFFICFWLK